MQTADLCDRLGSPGGEAPGLMRVAHGADDEGGPAGVAAVEDAAQLFAFAEEGVGLVDQERRLELLDRPEESGRQ